eukprot:scaffold232889_cov23-Tisochrysis_lutea.AAC.1
MENRKECSGRANRQEWAGQTERGENLGAPGQVHSWACLVTPFCCFGDVLAGAQARQACPILMPHNHKFLWAGIA